MCRSDICALNPKPFTITLNPRLKAVGTLQPDGGYNPQQEALQGLSPQTLNPESSQDEGSQHSCHIEVQIFPKCAPKSQCLNHGQPPQNSNEETINSPTSGQCVCGLYMPHAEWRLIRYLTLCCWGACTPTRSWNRRSLAQTVGRPATIVGAYALRSRCRQVDLT